MQHKVAEEVVTGNGKNRTFSTAPPTRGRCRKRNLKYVKAEERRGNKTQEGENMGEQILVLAQATEEDLVPCIATEVRC